MERRAQTTWLEFRIWFRGKKVGLGALLIVVGGAFIFIALTTPTIPYETMMSVLNALISLAGVLIAFTAVVSAQVLSAYRTQMERAVNPDEVTRRRQVTLSNIRGGILALVLSVLANIVLMARQIPNTMSPSPPLALGVYCILFGALALSTIIEDL